MNPFTFTCGNLGLASPRRKIAITFSGFLLLTLFAQSFVWGQSPASRPNHISNPGFENTGIPPWRWSISHDAQATGQIDKTEKYSGAHSYRITNASPKAPHVFACLVQTMTSLAPNTEYRASFWMKGDEVSKAVLAFGPGWNVRAQLPIGTYDWREVTFDFKTGNDAARWDIVVIADAPVGSLWVDDVSVVSLSQSPANQGVAEANPVENPGFELAKLSPWGWSVSKEAKATGVVDSTEKASGVRSFKITNASPREPNVFGLLRQAVKGLRPNTTYTVTFQIKGEDVTGGSFGCGPDWGNRKAFPLGTYDWTVLQQTFTTGDKVDEYQILFIASAPAKAIWIDDMTIAPEGSAPAPTTSSVGASSTNQSMVSKAAIWTDSIIPATLAFYPVFFVESPGAEALGQNNSLPMLRLSETSAAPDSSAQAQLGADIRIGRDSRNLFLHVTISDTTPGPFSHGSGLWRTDSVQLAIDTGIAAAFGGRVNNYHEIGFAPDGNGGVTMHDWESATDLSRIKTSMVKLQNGYALAITIPWESLSLDASRLPSDVGINIVINDGGAKGLTRNFVEWTPGTARVKDRSVFARAIFVSPNATSAHFLKSAKPDYDISDILHLVYTEYARQKQAAATLGFQIKTPDAQLLPPPSSWNNTPLDPLEQGSTRRIRFSAPASALPLEGDYLISATTPQSTAVITAKRYDMKSRIAADFVALQKSFSEIQKQAASSPTANTDSLVQANLAIVQHFLDRLSSPSINKKQTPAWSLLQLNEMKQVIESLKTRLAATPSSLSPAPQTNGNKATPTNYLYGYGHFGDVVRDLPLLSKTGSTLIQQERGPRDLQADGTFTPDIRRAREILDRARQNNVKVDFLLSPHYFPKWATDADKTLSLNVASGFIKYNIDHPTARQITKDWLQYFLPTIKDHSALNSFCISNEPVYLNSGHDPFSRPAWEMFLKTRHGSLANINALYGTHHASFSEIPVPSSAAPNTGGIGERRFLYDWIRFNHQNFADWHQWLNNIVKTTAPGIPTHSKIMMDIFERNLLPRIAEPELMCEITDFAGNDAYAWPDPWREYSYNWLYPSIWYDLLHSFRGQPVFNSENHLIRDGTPPVPVSPNHTRTVLWQGALHHMPLNTIWVWNENDAPALEGSIYFRPANISAATQAMLDLDRLSGSVSTISETPAQIAILYSITSLYWSDDYINALGAAYTALNFLGQPITFISEKQLAENRRTPATRDVRMLLIPAATHLSDATVVGLAEFVKTGASLVLLGEGNMTLDEYARPRTLPTALQASSNAIAPLAWKSGQEKILADKLVPILERRGLQLPRLFNVGKHEPAWGVEYRVVRTDPSRILISMTNFLPENQTVSFSMSGMPSSIMGRDLLNEESVVADSIILPPLQPRLIEIAFTEAASK